MRREQRGTRRSAGLRRLHRLSSISTRQPQLRQQARSGEARPARSLRSPLRLFADDSFGDASVTRLVADRRVLRTLVVMIPRASANPAGDGQLVRLSVRTPTSTQAASAVCATFIPAVERSARSGPADGSLGPPPGPGRCSVGAREETSPNTDVRSWRRCPRATTTPEPKQLCVARASRLVVAGPVKPQAGGRVRGPGRAWTRGILSARDPRRPRHRSHSPPSRRRSDQPRMRRPVSAAARELSATGSRSSSRVTPRERRPRRGQRSWEREPSVMRSSGWGCRDLGALSRAGQNDGHALDPSADRPNLSDYRHRHIACHAHLSAPNAD